MFYQLGSSAPKQDALTKGDAKFQLDLLTQNRKSIIFSIFIKNVGSLTLIGEKVNMKYRAT